MKRSLFQLRAAASAARRAAHTALRLAATMPMDRDYLRMMQEPTEESFWQTFASKFMDRGTDSLYPVGIPLTYDIETLGRMRWDALTMNDNVEKLRQLLDAQTNPDAATHALEMLLRRGSSSDPPIRCLRECVYVRGADVLPGFMIHRMNPDASPIATQNLVEWLREWRVAYLWRKVRAFSRLRHQLINLYERVCTPERVDFAADLAAATDGLYAT